MLLTALTALLMFTMVMVSDGLWTLYIQTTAEDKRLIASTSSAFIILLGGIGILIYVNNPWMLIPEMFGAFVGSYVVMTYRAKKKKQEKEELGPPHEKQK